MSDNINYFNKYLKYKIKYLELKSLEDRINLEGGAKIKKLKTLKKIKKLPLSPIKIEKKFKTFYNYLLSLINDKYFLINIKYDEKYYDFFKSLIEYLIEFNISGSNLELIKQLINVIIQILITQKTLLLDLYNNNNDRHLIIPLMTILLNSRIYQDEIKIFLKNSENEEIIKLLQKSNVFTIIYYLKNR